MSQILSIYGYDVWRPLSNYAEYKLKLEIISIFVSVWKTIKTGRRNVRKIETVEYLEYKFL